MSLFALVHNNATAIAWGTTVTLVGIVLEALGVAYLTNYRGIAHRAHERNISNWESAPILGKYIEGYSRDLAHIDLLVIYGAP